MQASVQGCGGLSPSTLHKLKRPSGTTPTPDSKASSTNKVGRGGPGPESVRRLNPGRRRRALKEFTGPW